MKAIFLILCLCLSIQSSATGVGIANAVKGFQEWRTDKIQAAVNQMLVVKSQILRAHGEPNKKNLENLEKQLDQIKWNLEVAKDLSVTDYFVLYLSQHSNPDRFQQAALKMSAKEVAQLMEAYANTLGPVPPTEQLVRPTQQAVAPARLPVHATQNRDQFK
ncbi:MAG: hypothetical protein ACAH59_11210 [Pseudobdellovibrionaceae bacterium]